MTIKDLMRLEATGATRPMSVEDVGRFLGEHRLTGVVVVDPDGRIYGVLPEDHREQAATRSVAARVRSWRATRRKR
jgi:CBS-domain-containing membrane protein